MFWEIIRANERRSFLLIVLMGLCLAGVGWGIGYLWLGAEEGGMAGILLASGVWAILLLVSLTAGDQILLSSVGAKEVTHDVHPQLFNVVDEMRIASGLPKLPKIYVIPDLGMNAFATGLSPERSSVAVTAGLLSHMDRDELQGVIGHEVSHIMNRDVLYMTLAGIMLGSMQLMSRVFLRSLGFAGRSNRRIRTSVSGKGGGGGAVLVFFALAVVLAILGPILAQIFYFSLSRKREYLADACSARLTRYPEGLASALEKIANHSSHLDSANAVTAPMYIAHPFGERSAQLLDWMSTHPPVEKRIQILRGLSQGVNFAQYESAFARVTGGRGIVPGSALQNQEVITPRTRSADQGQAVAPKSKTLTSRETLDLLRAANSYAFLTCACGLQIKVPPDFQGEEAECPRCHQRVSFPKARILTPAEASQARVEKHQADKKDEEGPVMEYRRQNTGWETFHCGCGAALQLSPQLIARRLECKKCGRVIKIL